MRRPNGAVVDRGSAELHHAQEIHREGVDRLRRAAAEVRDAGPTPVEVPLPSLVGAMRLVAAAHPDHCDACRELARILGQ